MSIGLQEYPTQFYGSTWIFWLGALYFGPFSVFAFVFGTLISLGIEAPPQGQPVAALVAGWAISGTLLFLLMIACAFQIYVRQYPVLKICREGIEVRLAGTLLPKGVSNNCLFVLASFIVPLIIPLIMVWQCITLRVFQIQTLRWQWDDIELSLLEKRAFTIAGWCEKDHNDFDQHDSWEYRSEPYNAGSFSVSIKKVIESVQLFLYHPGARDELPSWQDDAFV